MGAFGPRHGRVTGAAPLVQVSRAKGVATITLCRPDAGNALSVEMANAISEAVEGVAGDAEVRCVLMTAQGRFFCVGGDVKSMGVAADVGALLDRITTPLHRAITALLQMDKPLVVAVNGPVAGGGLGLALAGDIVIAAEAAHFSLAYAGIGFSPDGAATWLLPRLIGFRLTQELVFLNKRLSSAEAAAAGLITSVAKDEEVLARADEAAMSLAEGPVGAFAATRRLLLASWQGSAVDQMEAEAASVRVQAESAEGREGLSAFLQKRRPIFWP